MVRVGSAVYRKADVVVVGGRTEVRDVFVPDALTSGWVAVHTNRNCGT